MLAPARAVERGSAAAALVMPVLGVLGPRALIADAAAATARATPAFEDTGVSKMLLP